MKPIKEWLETLPEPYRTEALHECIKWGNSLVASESLAGAIGAAFNWAESEQGVRYWRDVRRRAEAGEFDQPNHTSELEALRQEVAALKAQLAAKEPLKVGDRVRVELPSMEGWIRTGPDGGTYEVIIDGFGDLEWAWLKPERLTRLD